MHHPHLAEHFTSHVASQVTAHFTSCVCVGQCLVMLKVHFFLGGAKHLLELWLHPLHVLHMATAQSTNTTFANWTLVSTNLCAPLWAATRMPHRTTLFTSGTHACWSAPNKLASNYGPGDAGNNIGNWQPTGNVQNVGMTLWQIFLQNSFNNDEWWEASSSFTSERFYVQFCRTHFGLEIFVTPCPLQDRSVWLGRAKERRKKIPTLPTSETTVGWNVRWRARQDER